MRARWCGNLGLLRAGGIERFGRFILIGGACYLGGLVVIYLAVEWARLPLFAAYVISFLLLNAVGYFANRGFTFRRQGSFPRMGLIAYWLVALIAFGCCWVGVALLQSLFDLGYLWACAIVAAAFSLINFLLHSMLTYSSRIEGVASVAGRSMERFE